jgi:hypothetical protein
MATNRYINTQITGSIDVIGTATFPYYTTTKYPEIPLETTDIYAITTDGDRLDLLAQQFYGDPSLYWIISCANPDKINLGSLFIVEGTEIRIPVNLSSILNSYSSLNNK